MARTMSCPVAGEEAGETLEEAVVRECREELGAEVRVETLLYIRECVEERPQRVEFAFLCTLLSAAECNARDGTRYESDGSAWLPFAALTNVAFYPKGVRERLPDIIRAGMTVSLGNLS